ncbi:hypothetical protein [Streptomyces globisporus]|uniref:hypothetical protein n=1 Tax=Streptomyces globisporus TaxID=1908 RepID=UPI0037CBE35F
MASRLNSRLARLERTAAPAPAALVDLVYERLTRPTASGRSAADILAEEFENAPPPGSGATPDYRLMHTLFAPKENR